MNPWASGHAWHGPDTADPCQLPVEATGALATVPTLPTWLTIANPRLLQG